MKEMKKVIVHPGNAHLDEFVGCAEVIAAECWRGPAASDDVSADMIICRREPTAEELADPEVYVLDVGMQHDPALKNFDHHQLPRGSRDCAMTLFAKSVRHPVTGETLFDLMRRLYPWYETRATLDSNGPSNAAKEKGVEWSVVESFLGPFEDIVLNAFIGATDEDRAKVVLPFAQDILAKVASEGRVREALERWTTGQGVNVIDFTKADPADVDVVSDAILAAEPNGVAVFRDKRGAGYAFLRIKDDPRVDLSKAKSIPCMQFVHVNGFYATTKEPVARAVIADILGTAYVEKQP